MGSKVRIAIAGVGNCASSLLQGIEHYRRVPHDQQEAWGLMHPLVYREALDKTFERDYLPRFAKLGIDARPAWE